jgi:hypothetical protein
MYYEIEQLLDLGFEFFGCLGHGMKLSFGSQGNFNFINLIIVAAFCKCFRFFFI